MTKKNANQVLMENRKKSFWSETTESPWVWTAENEEAEQGAKFQTFREIRELLSDYEVPRDGGVFGFQQVHQIAQVV